MRFELITSMPPTPPLDSISERIVVVRSSYGITSAKFRFMRPLFESKWEVSSSAVSILLRVPYGFSMARKLDLIAGNLDSQ